MPIILCVEQCPFFGLSSRCFVVSKQKCGAIKYQERALFVLVTSCSGVNRALSCIAGRNSVSCLQAGNFFAAYHAENLDALHSMLDKELWRRLPSSGAGVPIVLM